MKLTRRGKVVVTIVVVLDSAMSDQVWAVGEVTLTDGNGRVLHRMEAKG